MNNRPEFPTDAMTPDERRALRAMRDSGWNRYDRAEWATSPKAMPADAKVLRRQRRSDRAAAAFAVVIMTLAVLGSATIIIFAFAV